jgi:hypothetical protein
VPAGRRGPQTLSHPGVISRRLRAPKSAEELMFTDEGKLPVNAAYTAGLIDGEGCLGLYTRGRIKSPTVTVSMTDLDIIRWLKANFGGSFSKYTREGNGKNQSDQYRWSLNTKAQIHAFLELLYPYLKVKKLQADILLDFLNSPSCPGDEHVYLITIANSRGSGSAERKDELKRVLSSVQFKR